MNIFAKNINLNLKAVGVEGVTHQITLIHKL